MTLSTQMSKASFLGNGVSTAFPLPFPFLREADIKAIVSHDGAETPLVLGTHYILSGAGSSAGGQLTMLVPPATGQTLVVYRAPAIVQEVDYVENSAFPAETHEGALDLLTMICQSLQEQIGRAVVYPVSTPDGDILDSTSFLAAAEASKTGARLAQQDAAESAAKAGQGASAAFSAASRAELGAAAAEAVAATADGLVKISAGDTLPQSLSAKLAVGDGLAETLLCPGAEESLRLSVALAAASGLEFASGLLRVRPGAGLALSSTGLSIDATQISTTPALRPAIVASRILNHAMNGGF